MHDEYFEWIEKLKNPLVINWVWSHLVHTQFILPPSSSISTPMKLKMIIRTFDFYDSTSIDKEDFMMNLKYQWSLIFQSMEQFNWLKIKDEDQCKWAWEYLLKYRQNLFFHHPMDNEELYYSIITSIIILLPDYSAKQLFIDKLRTSCRQKKYRKKLGEKQSYSFIMSKQTKNKLSEIAKDKGVKINEAIECIIDEAHANNFKA